MRIKRKNGLKVAAITIALLLCLALAVGITGAWYQAKRQATGTLSMDQGIIIDYKGFNGSETGATWERGTTFELFSTKAGEVQPGAHIKVNAASIKANAESVNFYARVRLEYKFYNGDTEVTLEDPTVLIKTSNLFGSNWEFSSMAAPKDYYYYVENGTTTFKTMVAGADFVELIQSNAEFIIEGEGFVGADNNGASGGFVVDETTSINKIVVNLVLETLQGDADPATEGWKIATPVRFAEATGKMETSVNKTATTEDLNVSVAGATEVPINEIVFPYDTNTTLKFDSNNVEYITLTYDKGEPDTFEETALNTITVKADSSKGKVTGYTVGLWSKEEYVGFTYLTTNRYEDDGMPTYDIENGIAVASYIGDITEINIPSSAKVRNRDVNIVLTGYKTYDDLCGLIQSYMMSFSYKLKMQSKVNKEFNSLDELYTYLSEEVGIWSLGEQDATAYFGETITFVYSAFVTTNGIIGSTKDIKEIEYNAFYNREFSKVTIGEGVKVIGDTAFSGCNNLTELQLPSTLTKIGYNSFANCVSLKTISIPESLTYVGLDAFYGCNNLQARTTEGGISYLGNETNNYVLAWKITDTTLTSYAINYNCKVIYPGLFAGCSNATEIIIPSGVTSIADHTFINCTSLTNITIPNSVTSIGYMAFHNCRGLQSIIIPDSVTSIGRETFVGCTSLTNITTPSSVTNIGSDAFYNCNNLTISIGDIGGNWVKASDNTAVDANTLLKDIDYDIKRA